MPHAFSAKRLIPEASAAGYWYGQTEYSIIGKNGMPSSITAPTGRPIAGFGLAGMPGVRKSIVAVACWPSSEVAFSQTR